MTEYADYFQQDTGHNMCLLYLDFDGVLHHQNVMWTLKRGAYIDDADPSFKLFQHAALLSELLAPYPDIRIILSTSWVVHYGCYRTAKKLPANLKDRVIGATYHPSMFLNGFQRMPRGYQVVDDVKRRKPKAWLAIDDDFKDWPEEHLGNFVRTHPELGISEPSVSEALTAALKKLADA